MKFTGLSKKILALFRAGVGAMVLVAFLSPALGQNPSAQDQSQTFQPTGLVVSRFGGRYFRGIVEYFAQQDPLFKEGATRLDGGVSSIPDSWLGMEQDVERLARPALEFIYDLFTLDSLGRETSGTKNVRKLFSKDFISSLRDIDAVLPVGRTFWNVAMDPLTQKIYGVIGFFDGSPTSTKDFEAHPFYSALGPATVSAMNQNMNQSFHSHPQIPIEIHFPGIQLLGRKENARIIEIRRTGRLPHNEFFEYEQTVQLAGQYLEYMGLSSSDSWASRESSRVYVYVHTDRLGTRLYRRLGFEVELGPEALGEDHYILRVRASQLAHNIRPVTAGFPAGPMICNSLFSGFTKSKIP